MHHQTTMLGLFTSLPSWAELLIIAFVGLLLFGRRLPDVARSLGQSIVEFKKGMQGFKQEMENPTSKLPEKSSDRTAPSHALPESKVSESTTSPAQPAKHAVDSPD